MFNIFSLELNLISALNGVGIIVSFLINMLFLLMMLFAFAVALLFGFLAFAFFMRLMLENWLIKLNSFCEVFRWASVLATLTDFRYTLVVIKVGVEWSLLGIL